jgi:hypothetical protein
LGPPSVAAELERLATLVRRSERHLRNCPDCIYQDTDSVVVHDSPAVREAAVKVRRELNSLYGRLGERSRHAYPVHTHH